MRKLVVALTLLILFDAICANAQDLNLPGVLQSTLNGTSSLSDTDITKGLKEALKVGSENAGGRASKIDGFNKNPKIRIPFPQDAKDMRKRLIDLGMKKQVDEFELQLNRAAEDASKKAAPIFLDAIFKMSISDGLGILEGKDDAATDYLRNSTSSQLKAVFLPIVKSSLDKVEITRYWMPLFKRYNKLPMVKKVNPDLNDFVTQRAVEGLFMLVAEEEVKIRKDPAARINGILQQVFGGK
ncbi:MAG: DUF4197 domain-containing protein [Bacteroidota bacterium]|jgi:hypothetical protein